MKKEGKTLHDHFRIMQNLIFTGFIIMIIPALISMSGLWTGILMSLGFCVMAAACVYQHKYYKCPHCGSRLNVRGVPNYCPDCGKKLYEK